MTFWQSIVLQAVGPIVAAIFGTLIIGKFAAMIAERAQRQREEHRVRMQFISQMTKAASSLYFETQRYWRASEREGADATQLQLARKDLDEQYHKSRVAAEVLESRLRVLFKGDKPRQLWHATIDLITVRYFQVIGFATPRLCEHNAGPEHSGLSVEELAIPVLVLSTYHDRLREALDAVLEFDLTPIADPATRAARDSDQPKG